MLEETLIGRESELKILDDLYQRTGQSGVEILYTTGDPGIGKTSLSNHFMKTIEDSSLTAYTQCTSQSRGEEMYRPFIELISSLMPRMEKKPGLKDRFKNLLHYDLRKFLDVASEIMGLIPVAQLVSGGIKIGLALSSDGGDKELEKCLDKYKNDRVQFYVDLLLGWSIASPIAIVIDDIHWADTGTIAVLREIMRKNRELLQKNKIPRLFLIITARTTESLIGDKSTEVGKLLEYIKRYDPERLTEHRLGMMDNSELGLLLDFSLNCSCNLSDHFKQWIIEKSNGNPLFLKRLIDICKQKGALNLINNIWQDYDEVSFSVDKWELKGTLLAIHKTGAFQNLDAMVLDSLNGLSPQHRKILLNAAVLGETFISHTLAHVLEDNEHSLLWELGSLEKIGIIKRVEAIQMGTDESYRYCFSSKATQQALITEFLPIQLKWVRQRTADYLIKRAEKNKEDLNALEEMIENTKGSKHSFFLRRELRITNELMYLYHSASIQYESASDYFNAAKYRLEAISPKLDKLEELEDYSPAPAEREALEKDIDNELAQIKSLCSQRDNDSVLWESGLSFQDLINFDKRILEACARRKAVFGDYRSALENIREAEAKAQLTPESEDDLSLALSAIEISYKSGQRVFAREAFERILKIFESLDIDEDKLEVLTIGYIFPAAEEITLNDVPAVAIVLLKKILSILQTKDIPTEEIKGYMVLPYIRLLRYDEADKIINSLKETFSFDICQKIAFSVNDFLSKHDSQFTNMMDDSTVNDNDFISLLNIYEWACLFTKDLYENHKSYNIPLDEALIFFDQLLRWFCHLLHARSSYISQEECLKEDRLAKDGYFLPDEISEEDDESDPSLSLCIEFTGYIDSLLEKVFPRSQWSQELFSGLSLYRSLNGDEDWTSLGDALCSCYYAPLGYDSMNELYLQVINHLKSGGYGADLVDIYYNYIKFLINNFIADNYPEDARRRLDLIINEIALKSDEFQERISSTLSLLYSSIADYYIELKDDGESAWFWQKKSIIAALESGDTSSAKIYLDECRKKFKQYIKEIKELEKKIKNDMGLKSEEKHGFDELMESDDPYLAAHQAGQYLDHYKISYGCGDGENAEEACDETFEFDPLMLRYLSLAKKKAEFSELGKPILDDIYSSLSDFFGMCYRNGTDLPEEEIKRLDISVPEGFEGYEALYLSLFCAKKAMDINEELGNYHRVIDEIERIHNTINIAKSIAAEDDNSQGEYVCCFAPLDSKYYVSKDAKTHLAFFKNIISSIFGADIDISKRYLELLDKYGDTDKLIELVCDYQDEKIIGALVRHFEKHNLNDAIPLCFAYIHQYVSLTWEESGYKKTFLESIEHYFCSHKVPVGA